MAITEVQFVNSSGSTATPGTFGSTPVVGNTLIAIVVSRSAWSLGGATVNTSGGWNAIANANSIGGAWRSVVSGDTTTNIPDPFINIGGGGGWGSTIYTNVYEYSTVASGSITGTTTDINSTFSGTTLSAHSSTHNTTTGNVYIGGSFLSPVGGATVVGAAWNGTPSTVISNNTDYNDWIVRTAVQTAGLSSRDFTWAYIGVTNGDSYGFNSIIIELVPSIVTNKLVSHITTIANKSISIAGSLTTLANTSLSSTAALTTTAITSSHLSAGLYTGPAITNSLAASLSIITQGNNSLSATQSTSALASGSLTASQSTSAKLTSNLSPAITVSQTLRPHIPAGLTVLSTGIKSLVSHLTTSAIVTSQLAAAMTTILSQTNSASASLTVIAHSNPSRAASLSIAATALKRLNASLSTGFYATGSLPAHLWTSVIASGGLAASLTLSAKVRSILAATLSVIDLGTPNLPARLYVGIPVTTSMSAYMLVGIPTGSSLSASMRTAYGASLTLQALSTVIADTTYALNAGLTVFVEENAQPEFPPPAPLGNDDPVYAKSVLDYDPNLTAPEKVGSAPPQASTAPITVTPNGANVQTLGVGLIAAYHDVQAVSTWANNATSSVEQSLIDVTIPSTSSILSASQQKALTGAIGPTINLSNVQTALKAPLNPISQSVLAAWNNYHWSYDGRNDAFFYADLNAYSTMYLPTIQTQLNNTINVVSFTLLGSTSTDPLANMQLLANSVDGSIEAPYGQIAGYTKMQSTLGSMNTDIAYTLNGIKNTINMNATIPEEAAAIVLALGNAASGGNNISQLINEAITALEGLRILFELFSGQGWLSINGILTEIDQMIQGFILDILTEAASMLSHFQGTVVYPLLNLITQLDNFYGAKAPAEINKIGSSIAMLSQAGVQKFEQVILNAYRNSSLHNTLVTTKIESTQTMTQARNIVKILTEVITLLQAVEITINLAEAELSNIQSVSSQGNIFNTASSVLAGATAIKQSAAGVSTDWTNLSTQVSQVMANGLSGQTNLPSLPPLAIQNPPPGASLSTITNPSSVWGTVSMGSPSNTASALIQQIQQSQNPTTSSSSTSTTASSKPPTVAVKGPGGLNNTGTTA